MQVISCARHVCQPLMRLSYVLVSSSAIETRIRQQAVVSGLHPHTSFLPLSAHTLYRERRGLRGSGVGRHGIDGDGKSNSTAVIIRQGWREAVYPRQVRSPSALSDSREFDVNARAMMS